MYIVYGTVARGFPWQSIIVLNNHNHNVSMPKRKTQLGIYI